MCHVNKIRWILQKIPAKIACLMKIFKLHVFFYMKFKPSSVLKFFSFFISSTQTTGEKKAQFDI